MHKKFKGIKKKLREKLSHSKRRVRNIFSDKNKQIFVRGFFYGCCIGAILHAYPAYGQEAGGNFTNAKDMKPRKPSAILVFGFSLTCGIISGLLITVYLIQLHDAKLLRLYNNYILEKYSN